MSCYLGDMDTVNMHQTCMDIFLCVCVCVCVSVDTHACIMGTMSVA